MNIILLNYMACKNSILLAMQAMRIYGKKSFLERVSGKNIGGDNDMLIPVRNCITKYNFNRKGKWQAGHISDENLAKNNPIPSLKYRCKRGKGYVAHTLLQLYTIPLYEQCDTWNVLKIGYIIGRYESYYGHVSKDYGPDYYTELFDKNKLGNINNYIKPGSLILHPSELDLLMEAVNKTSSEN